MADYLLDTNHASPLVTLSHPLRQRILQRAQEGHRTKIGSVREIPTNAEFRVSLSPFIIPRSSFIIFF